MAGPELATTAAAEKKQELGSDPSSARRARYGLVLFAFYLALYGGFVLLNAFAPSLMEVTLAGVNLAVLYGLGLIAAAFLLALLYDWLCRALAGGGRSEGERGQ
jgi:uncharacterized membrane protein (DUF485 family)